MFSVVIPLYNKERSIRNTLQSVLDQTFRDFEVIIVNDGSTDKSLEVVQMFNDDRIRIINQKNSGVSSARNKGINEAQHEWIAFLDADDLWEKEKLKEVFQAIYANPDIKWVIHAYKAISKYRIIKHIHQKVGVLNNVIDELKNGLKIQTSAVIIKRKLFINDPRLYFRVGLNNSEDIEVWYKISILFLQPYYINKILSSYTIDYTGTSLTKLLPQKEKVLTYLSMRERLQSVIDENNKQNAEKMEEFIQLIKVNSILGSWVYLREFPDIYEEDITPKLFKILKSTVRLPMIIKRIILKLYLLVR